MAVDRSGAPATSDTKGSSQCSSWGIASSNDAPKSAMRGSALTTTRCPAPRRVEVTRVIPAYARRRDRCSMAMPSTTASPASAADDRYAEFRTLAASFFQWRKSQQPVSGDDITLISARVAREAYGLSDDDLPEEH